MTKWICVFFGHKWKYSSKDPYEHGDIRVCRDCDREETYTISYTMCGGEIDAYGPFECWKYKKRNAK